MSTCSILVTRLGPWRALAAELRGDDVFLRAAAVARSANTVLWSGLVAGQVAGLAWALTARLGPPIVTGRST